MKIRTEKDVQALDLKLKSELGVDVSKYRNPEIAEKFVDLLIFPQFVLNWTLRPIIASLILYASVFFVIELTTTWLLIYAIFGFLLFMAEGVLIGMILVLWKLKTDIYSVLKYSLTIMKGCVLDIKHMNKTTTTENRKETLGLLFLGITHIVTIPMVTVALTNKVPLIGGLLNNIVKKILRLVAVRIKFNYTPNQTELVGNETRESVTNAYVRSIDHTITGLDKLLTIVLRLGQFPIAVFTVITTFLLCILFIILT
jgi:hypothetical protein